MKLLYYGWWGYLFCEFLLRGSVLVLIFGMITGWIFYNNYATASFCQTIFCMFILTMNLLQVFGLPFNSAIPAFYRLITGVMLIYNVVGLFWCYQAFQVFKQAFNELHGVGGPAGANSYLIQQPPRHERR